MYRKNGKLKVPLKASVLLFKKLLVNCFSLGIFGSISTEAWTGILDYSTSQVLLIPEQKKYKFKGLKMEIAANRRLEHCFQKFTNGLRVQINLK